MGAGKADDNEITTFKIKNNPQKNNIWNRIPIYKFTVFVVSPNLIKHPH